MHFDTLYVFVGFEWQFAPRMHPEAISGPSNFVWGMYPQTLLRPMLLHTDTRPWWWSRHVSMLATTHFQLNYYEAYCLLQSCIVSYFWQGLFHVCAPRAWLTCEVAREYTDILIAKVVLFKPFKVWLYYIIITIVQSYTGKYHKFIAVCIVTSAQHE